MDALFVQFIKHASQHFSLFVFHNCIVHNGQYQLLSLTLQ